MKLDLRTKLEALLITFTCALLVYIATDWTPVRYVVCPDGTNECTPYQPHEVKVFYE
jgi:hypothetical protein